MEWVGRWLCELGSLEVEDEVEVDEQLELCRRGLYPYFPTLFWDLDCYSMLEQHCSECNDIPHYHQCQPVLMGG